MKIKDIVIKLFFVIILIMMIIFLKNIIGVNYDLYFYILIILLILLFLIKRYKNFFQKYQKIINILLIVCIAIGIILRVVLIFLEYQPVKSDYATFYWNSVNLSNGNDINFKYISMFPHLGYYIILLANIMKIFGSNYKVVIIVNVVFDILSIIGMYLYFKKEKNNAILAASIWSLNPINIIWCRKCIPIVIFNTCLIYSLLSFSRVKKMNNNKKIILPSIILGFVMGISNLFRPIIIVLFISIFIFYLYLIIYKNKKFLMLFLSLILIFLPYKIVTKSMEIVLEKTINNEVNHSGSGWNVYVGSNIYCQGSWCSFLANEMESKMDDDNFDPNELNDYFMNKGLDNYLKNNTFQQNLGLMKIKYRTLTSTIGYGSVDNLELSEYQISKIPYYNTLYKLTRIWCDMFMILSVLSVIILSAYGLKKAIDDNYLEVILLLIGILLSHLFVEVSARYMLPLIVPLSIILVNMLWKEIEYVKEVK